MVWLRGNLGVRVCVTLGLALTFGCAGGESETVGNISPSGPSSAGESTTGLEPSGPTSEGETTTEPMDTTSGPPPFTTSPTDPSTATDDDPTTGPPVACMFAKTCDDLDPCTEDNCINSVCVNEPIDCDDGFDCTIDSCDMSGACVHLPDDAECDDADMCNGIETCTTDAGCQMGTAVTCNDSEACTADSCEPSTGTCEFETIDTCSGGDGCCPLGCSVANDSDCTCDNLTAGATPSSSGGGSGDYGPDHFIDGVDETACNAQCSTSCFGWIFNSAVPTGSFIELEWPSAQTIGSMHIDTTGGGTGTCNVDRPLSGGTVRYWSAGAWINAASFSGNSGNYTLNFSPPFTTTRVQIYDAVTNGNNNSIIFEWSVYEPLGCAPP